ncbi:hypothetical protein [Nitratireductor sp. XY-223]|uniref:hypothetical protein n=1 Tax=Nitratireductor sp. XY-223 TaxID=2561926 RepID=UPI0010A9B6CB|nr:hypothetical protein [Nitratireductor sp. XY-223]
MSFIRHYYRVTGYFCAVFPRDTCEVCLASRNDAIAIFTILFSVIIVSNFIYDITDLLPWFDAYGPLKSATSFIYDLLSNVTILLLNLFLIPLDYFVFLCTLLASYVSKITPYFPNFSLPVWYGKLAVPSILLTRLFKICDEIVPTELRGELRESMPDADQRILKDTGNPFLVWPWFFTDEINRRFYWTLINVTEEKIFPFILTLPLRLTGVDNRFATSIFRNLAYTIAGALMLGYVKLVGYILYLFKNRSLNYPVMDAYRRWLKTLLSLAIFITVFSSSLIVFERLLLELFEPRIEQFL